MVSVRIGCNFRDGDYPIGLAEVGEVSQASFELPDLLLSLPIGLLMPGRSHDVFDPHGLKCLLPELGGGSWVSITDNGGRFSMRRTDMVPD